MPTGIICISSESIEAGLAGSCRLKCSVDCESWESESFEEHYLYKPLAKAIRSLLISPTSLDIVIVEPPLFPFPLKKTLSRILLGGFRVRSLAFLQLSVCIVVGSGLASGLVHYTSSRGETMIVPVYDYREMTTLIESTEEQSAGEADKKVLGRCGRDVRGTLQDRKPIAEFTSADAFLGASVIAKGSMVRPQLTRNEFLAGKVVYDSLFHDINSWIRSER